MIYARWQHWCGVCVDSERGVNDRFCDRECKKFQTSVCMPLSPFLLLLLFLSLSLLKPWVLLLGGEGETVVLERGRWGGGWRTDGTASIFFVFIYLFFSFSRARNFPNF